ncbi:hypothetical protein HYU14_05310 [Candidatus Woesearchaeota archaeon]|nr:hypothetical protein [Candidatus Woesearchaeota archaeon]
MKLKKIMEKEGTTYQKVLIPSNSGLLAMEPDPFKALGVQSDKAEKYRDTGLDIEVVKARGEDIPMLCDEYARKGVCACGLTGDDFADEYRARNPGSQLRFVDTIDWMIEYSPRLPWDERRFSRPTLCLIGGKGDKLPEEGEESSVAINSNFEFISRQYIEELREDGIILKTGLVLNGKMENFIPSDCRFGIEVVVSGKSLKYVDKDKKTPRNPYLDVLYKFRQSDMSVITSWPRNGQMQPNPEFSLDFVLKEQYGRIQERYKNPTESTTSKLLKDRNIATKKAGEEFAEAIAEFARNNKEGFKVEMQQAIWALMVMAVSLGISWDEFLAEVKKQQ